VRTEQWRSRREVSLNSGVEHYVSNSPWTVTVYQHLTSLLSGRSVSGTYEHCLLRRIKHPATALIREIVALLSFTQPSLSHPNVSCEEGMDLADTMAGNSSSVRDTRPRLSNISLLITKEVQRLIFVHIRGFPRLLIVVDNA
jgi:hypothetical protein